MTIVKGNEVGAAKYKQCTYAFKFLDQRKGLKTAHQICNYKDCLNLFKKIYFKIVNRDLKNNTTTKIISSWKILL